MFAFVIVHVSDAQDAAEFACFYLHRSGLGRRTGRGLRKCSGHSGVEGGVAFGFLERLMDVPVENRDRAEAFQVTVREFAVARAPTPLLIKHPERDAREK